MSKDQTFVWLAGRWGDKKRDPWHVQGIFSTKEAAVDACRDSTYFVIPFVLDNVLPHSAVVVDGSFYPIEQ